MAASNPTARINKILAGHAMRGQGQWFVYYANRYGVDVGLLVGIAAAETTWGDAGTGRASQGYGAFGVGPRVRYGSYKEAIGAAAKLLSESYHQWSRPGKANPGGMAPKWVGYSAPGWVQTASKYANSFRGGGKGGGVQGGPVYPTGKRGQIIGTPYQGTHAPGATTAASWQSDNAIDIGIPIGTPIFAVVTGKIVRVHYQSGQYTKGWTITIQGAGNEFFYAHLSKVNVKEGQTIKAGMVMGKSGEANGTAHLHFAMEHGNPLDWIKGKPVGASQPGPPSSGPGGSSGAGAHPAPLAYQPHYMTDLASTLGDPGQDPILDVGPQPGSVARMWQSIAALNNPSPETMTFAQRAQMWGGNT